MSRSLRRLLPVVVAMGAALTGGCDALFGTGPDVPREALVEVEAEATEPLLLVVSKEFEIFYDVEEGAFVTILEAADTTTLETAALPFTVRHDLQPENRFLARVVNPAADTAQVRLVVRLDGSIGHDRTLRIANGQYIEYSTTY